MLDIKVRKVRDSAQIPEHIGGDKQSCWMDLYTSRIEIVPEYGRPDILDVDLRFRGERQSMNYKAGDIVKIGFGVAMELPEGYEGYVVPRSSTEKNFGLILTNSHGVIDESYAGDTDEWMGRFIAIRDGSIRIGDRPAQFRIQKKMPKVNIIQVDHLGNANRGGYGTSGK